MEGIYILLIILGFASIILVLTTIFVINKYLDASKSKKKDKKEPKIKKTTYNLRPKTIFLYSNIAKPYLDIYIYQENILVKNYHYDIDESNINVDGTLIYDDLVKRIKEDKIDLDNIELILDIKECFKNTISLPNIAKYKASGLFSKQFKSEVENKDNYMYFTNLVKHDLGYIYYTYFIPNTIIKSFKKLAILLKVKLINVNLLANWVCGHADNKAFSGIYLSNNLGLVYSSYNNKLIAYNSFYYESSEDIISNYLIYIANHEFEFERLEIKTCLLSSKTLTSEDLKELKPVILDIDFNNYFNNGIKL